MLAGVLMSIELMYTPPGRGGLFFFPPTSNLMAFLPAYFDGSVIRRSGGLPFFVSPLRRLKAAGGPAILLSRLSERETVDMERILPCCVVSPHLLCKLSRGSG